MRTLELETLSRVAWFIIVDVDDSIATLMRHGVGKASANVKDVWSLQRYTYSLSSMNTPKLPVHPPPL